MYLQKGYIGYGYGYSVSIYLYLFRIERKFKPNHQENLENSVKVKFYKEDRNPNLILYYLI